MTQFGTCGHCGQEWYSVQGGRKVQPVSIPTCPEAGIMAVCEHCFDTLSSPEIIVIAIQSYRASENDNDETGDGSDIQMSPTEQLLVESSIKGWVPYMKRETGEPPFTKEAFMY